MDKPALLAQPEFFTQRARSGKIVCARMPISEGIAHFVVADAERDACYCSCAFRPRPCVHALALAALYAREGAVVFEEMSELPHWAEALRSGQPPTRATDPPERREMQAAARRQRRIERLDRAAAGLEDLEHWLQDTLRMGLATLVSEDPAALMHIAARMADASLPGLSRQLRLLGQLSTHRPDWAERIAEGLAACALAVRAFRHRHTLSDATLADLQTFIGIAARREDVLASGERLTDHWLVLALREEMLEGNDRLRRTWLLGLHSGRFALLLDFDFARQGFPPAFLPGTTEYGTAIFYPSALPLRAVWEGESGQAQAGSAAAVHLQTAPPPALPPLVTGPFPLLLRQAVPLLHEGRFWMQAASGEHYPMAVADNAGWQLLALSGGHPLTLFGEWDGAVLLPLGVEAEDRWVTV